MSIVLHLDEVMARRHVRLSELAKAVDITNANMSNLKTGKVKAIRFSTLDKICEYLDCQPGDIIQYEKD
ncbi:MAG: helix-turn-helix transcriptional regulator [Coriobacteriia bacterium]|nr:helix-turn-helix transcriptional regulator [Coriobacteriia bacterium]